MAQTRNERAARAVVGRPHRGGTTDVAPAVRVFLDVLARLMVRDIFVELEQNRSTPMLGEPQSMPDRTVFKC